MDNGKDGDRYADTAFAQVHDDQGHQEMQHRRKKRRVMLIAGVVVVLVAAVIALIVCLTHKSSESNKTNKNSSDPSSSIHHIERANETTKALNLLQFCNEQYLQQPLNHSQPAFGNYQQRYFVCSQDPKRENQTIFFYAGNEAFVELYLNNTGLMWENADEFKAVLVFAEHRYFGKSLPSGFIKADGEVLRTTHLSTLAALADYVELIKSIKKDLKMEAAPVIGFGGSYGGELAYWLRLKHPEVVEGVIAASAPILGFLGDKNRTVDSEGFARTVMYDASPDAGSNKYCVPALRYTLKRLPEVAKDPKGKELLQKVFSECTSPAVLHGLSGWLMKALNYMSMGNYPFPSSYMTSGEIVLPAFPMRATCNYFEKISESSDDKTMVQAVANTFEMFYGSTSCLKLAGIDDPEQERTDTAWMALTCKDMYLPYTTNNVRDMYGSSDLDSDLKSQQEWCGPDFDAEAGFKEYGGYDALKTTSNIVFSNGEYDPWMPMGVLQNVSESVLAVMIQEGAHHVDLFFSTDKDPQSLRDARAFEKQQIHKWIKNYQPKANNTTG